MCWNNNRSNNFHQHLEWPWPPLTLKWEDNRRGILHAIFFNAQGLWIQQKKLSFLFFSPLSLSLSLCLCLPLLLHFSFSPPFFLGENTLIVECHKGPEILNKKKKKRNWLFLPPLFHLPRSLLVQSLLLAVELWVGWLLIGFRLQ